MLPVPISAGSVRCAASSGAPHRAAPWAMWRAAYARACLAVRSAAICRPCDRLREATRTDDFGIGVRRSRWGCAHGYAGYTG